MRPVVLAGALVAAGASAVASAAMTPEPIAVLQGLDKVAARVSQIEVPIGSSVNFGTLAIIVRDCETAPPEDPPNSAAFIQISETPTGGSTRRLFSGWMFSANPALSGLEHPVYDVTLLKCKAANAAAPAPIPSAQAAPATPAPTTPNAHGKTQR
jgi:hypothetical protein